jgi:hypothetical protein
MRLNDQALASKRGTLRPGTPTGVQRSQAVLVVLCERCAEIINQVVGMFETD